MKRSRLHPYRAVLVPLMALAAASCSDAEPVGRLQVSPATTRLGFPEARSLRLTFEPLRELDKTHGPPTVFLHLLHPVRKTVRTFDHVLPEPWTPGVVQSYEIDLYQSALTEPLPAGTYQLGVGLYDQTYGYRWPLETSGKEVDRREYAVATVEIREPADRPAFEFLGTWYPPEQLDQQQIPVRRCLAGPASLEVTQAPTPTTLRLRFFSPSPTRIESTCSHEPEALNLTTPGPHWLTFPLTNSTCSLTFTPSSVAHPPCLEVLSVKDQPR